MKVILVENLENNNVRLKQPFEIVVTQDESGFQAKYPPANIGFNGETEEHAVSKLKELIVETLIDLNDIPVKFLGEKMTEKKEILEKILCI